MASTCNCLQQCETYPSLVQTHLWPVSYELPKVFRSRERVKANVRKASSPTNINRQTGTRQPNVDKQKFPTSVRGEGGNSAGVVSKASTAATTTTEADTNAAGVNTKKMNGLSFSELCCLFCCPPCPGRIASKLAFLPPEASYDLNPEADNTNSKFTLTLHDKADWQYTDREKECFEVFYARSSRGNKIACLFVKCSANARFTLLFSHGNAVDLGQMTTFFIGLGQRINCNIFSYDYSGYGQSSGKPTEKNLYADIDAAWHALRTRYGISPENIILYGQSIGTVPTVDLASRYEVGAVILHSPLMSGMRVAFPATKRTWFFDAFPSIDKVPKVTSPVLVIHGTEDEVIDFSHGMTIYEKCPRAVEPLWVEGAGHNDVEMYSQYLERLKQFVSVELVN